MIGRRFFAEIQDIEGDVGARHLIGAYPELVHEVEMEGDAILLDIDTPEALARLTGIIRNTTLETQARFLAFHDRTSHCVRHF